jgi:hypothetical protein
MSSSASISSDTQKEKIADDTTIISAPSTDVEKQQPPLQLEQPDYVTGLKLWSMMAGVTLVCFVMLLDISIVSTVCRPARFVGRRELAANPSMAGDAEDHQRFSQLGQRRLVWRRLPVSQCRLATIDRQNLHKLQPEVELLRFLPSIRSRLSIVRRCYLVQLPYCWESSGRHGRVWTPKWCVKLMGSTILKDIIA